MAATSSACFASYSPAGSLCSRPRDGRDDRGHPSASGTQVACAGSRPRSGCGAAMPNICPTASARVVATLLNLLGAGIRWGVTVPGIKPDDVVTVLGPGVRGSCVAVASGLGVTIDNRLSAAGNSPMRPLSTSTAATSNLGAARAGSPASTTWRAEWSQGVLGQCLGRIGLGHNESRVL
jgi:hypothetical protein